MEHDGDYRSFLFGGNVYGHLVRICLREVAVSGQKFDMGPLYRFDAFTYHGYAHSALYWVDEGLGLNDSYLPLILPYFCGGGAFNIF